VSDPRLDRKIKKTRATARARDLDLVDAPMLVTFEPPILGRAAVEHDVAALARCPGTAVAIVCTDPLPVARRAIGNLPRLHVIAERGLVCGLSGGATHHVYAGTELEMVSFSTALFAGVAPAEMRVAVAPFLSSGRQEVDLEGEEPGLEVTGRELYHAIQHERGFASLSADEDVLVEDDPQSLEDVRNALAHELPDRYFRVSRLPTGTFRFTPDRQPRPAARDKVLAMAQGIAMSCDRFLEIHGGTRFGFVTESVARWEHGSERGAAHLAEEIFGSPDAVVTHLGQHPFSGDGTLFFVYEGSETILEAQNKDVTYVTVSDIPEYARILHTIRSGG
jgi:hypothetical protein